MPYHKAKMLYLSNLEKKFLSNCRGIKVAFFRVQRPDYKTLLKHDKQIALSYNEDRWLN